MTLENNLKNANNNSSLEGFDKDWKKRWDKFDEDLKEAQIRFIGYFFVGVLLFGAGVYGLYHSINQIIKNNSSSVSNNNSNNQKTNNNYGDQK